MDLSYDRLQNERIHTHTHTHIYIYIRRVLSVLSVLFKYINNNLTCVSHYCLITLLLNMKTAYLVVQYSNNAMRLTMGELGFNPLQGHTIFLFSVCLLYAHPAFYYTVPGTLPTELKKPDRLLQEV
jgi:hypothetical protein